MLTRLNSCVPDLLGVVLPVFEHLTPEAVISGLRLLMDVYKLRHDRFKDKKTPDKVEEILTRAEQRPQADSNEIERSLSEDLDPTDAATVKRDLELLSLVMLPAPSLDAFDYWGKLTQLVAGLQKFATKNRLFTLRGQKKTDLGVVLVLPRSGKVILPDNLAPDIASSAARDENVKDANCIALLREEPSEFPILAWVGAQFYEYSVIGGPPGIKTDSCVFSIGPGQQRHWLRFSRAAYTPHFRQRYEYRLEASGLISIVEALRDDIQEYAMDVQADEQKIAPLFAQIDAFVEKTKT
jgi:hypothetical protein